MCLLTKLIQIILNNDTQKLVHKDTANVVYSQLSTGLDVPMKWHILWMFRITIGGNICIDDI